MWQTSRESEWNGRVHKIIVSDSQSRLKFSDVLRLLRESADFRSYLTTQLSNTPFTAFRWETPPVTLASVDQEFECVVLDSPGIARTPDVRAFSSYFDTHPGEDVAVFPNLGNDAVMIVPCPIAADSTYGHFAAFLRNAPEHQQHALWKAIGQAMAERLSDQTVWLNTAGGGVSWLHVRLDSRPKYYHYSPYTSPPLEAPDLASKT
ncbi:MAG: hypothetical protein KF770_21135 [Anaerolineae bacterium]|nr:hypothetical protein [Anaerolineae bacterium]